MAPALTAATAVGRFRNPLTLQSWHLFYLESSLTTSNPFPSSSLKSTQANPGGDDFTILIPSATVFASLT